MTSPRPQKAGARPEAELAAQKGTRIGEEPVEVSRKLGGPFERRANAYDELRRYLNKPVLDPSDVTMRNLLAARRAAKKGVLPGPPRHAQVSVRRPVPIPRRKPPRVDFYVEGKEIISV